MATKSSWLEKAVVWAGAFIAFLGLGTAQAFNPQPDPPGQWRFGIVSVGEGQVIRLNIANLGKYAPPCKVSLGFVDAEGGELVPAVLKAVPPGGSLSVEWRFAPTNAAALQAQVRPVAFSFCDGSVRPAARRSGPYAPTVEVLEGDGSVRFFISAPPMVHGIGR
jgi:hypothetical protein